MKQLNSVIIEGTITGKPEYNQYVGIRALRFMIANEREANDTKKVYKFECVCYGNMAERLSGIGHLKEGRDVRVVGRLSVEKMNINNKEISKTVIIVEHIEFKPVKKQEAENDSQKS